MRFVLILLASIGACGQTAITFDPALVTHCNSSGLGSGTVSWNYDGGGQVQVRVGAVDGATLTGLAGPQGSVAINDLVIDGMVFILTDGGPQELARTTPAIVRCNPAGEVLAQGLATASYFPLQVGNEWIYSYSSRVVTSAYLTRRISQAVFIGEVAWFVLEDTFGGTAQPSLSWFRNDDAGRIYQLTSRGEKLWLDPSVPPDPSATLQIAGMGGVVQVPAGRFQNTLSYRVVSGGLDLETGTFARGIGLATNSHTMLTGSSGGFTEGMTLVYARIDGHVVFGSPSSSLDLGVESNSFDVSNKNTANCAVPCYFVACGLAPGADPPGTYRPCFQARVRMGQTGSAVQACDLDLLDSSNNSLYHATLTGTSDSESIVANQVPLYVKANQPFPPGRYQLRAQTPDGRTSIAPIQLK